MEDQSGRKRLRDDADLDELDFQSAEVKRLRDNLLGFLDDADPDPRAPDLDSLIRSFQDEIAAAPASSLPSPSPSSAAVEVVDLTAESGDSKSELGYLLEASDDELGLPPSTTPSSGEAAGCEAELVRVAPEPPGISEFWEFDDRIPSYGDSFQFGAGDGYGGGDEEGAYVAFDGLFDHSDAGFDPSDLLEFSWRRGETMPAL